MSKLVKEIAGLCYGLDKLYYKKESSEEKKEIEKNFKILSRLLEKSIRSQFDENDSLYKKEVRKLRKISRNLKKAEVGLYRYDKLIADISEIADKLDLIISFVH